MLSPDDRRRVEQAIRDAEARTSGEFVAVIARASDTYLFAPIAAAAAAAFATPFALWLLGVASAFAPLYAAQLAVFVALAALLRWTPATMLLVPRAVKLARARRLAHEQFHNLGLNGTRGRTGVLLFVSQAERYVEILADRGINEAVPPGTWEGVIADFTLKVRAGRSADGYIAAVTACGDLLARHFPRAPEDKDELPNVLVEL